MLSILLFHLCCNCTRQAQLMPLFHHLFNLASVERSSLYPLPHSCSFSCLFSCGLGSHMGNQIREMIRVKAHLAKIRKGLILTSPNSDPRVRGFAALPALPVFLCCSAERAGWLHPERHPHCQGSRCRRYRQNSPRPGAVEKGPLLPFTL